MNSRKNSQPIDSEEIEAKNTLSIDEFFKQLEAKEKDLDISSELIIEIDEPEFDEDVIPAFTKAELSGGKGKASEKLITDDQPSRASLSKLENETAKLRSQVSKMEMERVEILETSRRRQTDFENYKKRTERERSEIFLSQISNLATQMLPVLDNFSRALESATNLTGEKALDSQHFFNGIVLVNQQLNEVLSEMGVQPIVSVGEHFDPHLHEAVAMEETNEVPPDIITAELLRGYRIGDRVIRPSMVKVSKSRVSSVESREK